MSVIIKLRGVGSSGKTTTLKLLIDELKKLGAKVIMSCPNAMRRTVTNDIIVKLDFNGKIIGITTAGDDTGSLDFGYQQLGAFCDIYIFACRTKGSTIYWFDKTFPDCRIITYERWFIDDTADPPYLKSFRDKANKDQVVSMIDLIKQL